MEDLSLSLYLSNTQIINMLKYFKDVALLKIIYTLYSITVKFSWIFFFIEIEKSFLNSNGILGVTN